ncbi:ZIP family metal transporter [Streptomyces sp. NPDC057136]|uniref:ZIP family metal transporter n=1 Tax=Streptomyces sp. NPDC057136 TaxID=3346029 RepID=UPI00362CE674
MNALAAAGWGALAAFSLVIGAWLALRYRPSPRTTGRILGFGAGALIAAVAYELVPKGHVESAWDFLFVGIGAVVFFGIDGAVARKDTAQRTAGTPHSANRSIVLGALLDGIPESLVLGMGLSVGGTISIPFLAAVFLSNLPESLGATAGMREEGQQPRAVYRTWWGITAVAAACAALGYSLVQLFPTSEGRYVEAFAAGAVLTMLTNSMMPESFKLGGRVTGLCTVLGFAAAGALSLLE